MTVYEAAKILGVSPQYIRRLCSQGRIKAEMPGRDWVILEDKKKLKKGLQAGVSRAKLKKVSQ